VTDQTPVTDQTDPTPVADPAPMTVLHVCTGNICRSPMAERLMQSALAVRFGAAAGIGVRAAGTYGGNAGAPMHPPAADALAELGVEAGGFRATWLREPQLAWADLVLTATAEHRSAVLQLDPRALRRTFTLREFARITGSVGAQDLPPGTPGQRLAALTALASELRAVHPSAGRGADDIADPFGGPLPEYRTTARLIQAAIEDILRPL
jgi:protein-tyrosine phosphatase